MQQEIYLRLLYSVNVPKLGNAYEENRKQCKNYDADCYD